MRSRANIIYIHAYLYMLYTDRLCTHTADMCTRKRAELSAEIEKINKRMNKSDKKNKIKQLNDEVMVPVKTTVDDYYYYYYYYYIYFRRVYIELLLIIHV